MIAWYTPLAHSQELWGVGNLRILRHTIILSTIVLSFVAVVRMKMAVLLPSSGDIETRLKLLSRSLYSKQTYVFYALRKHRQEVTCLVA